MLELTTARKWDLENTSINASASATSENWIRTRGFSKLTIGIEQATSWQSKVEVLWTDDPVGEDQYPGSKTQYDSDVVLPSATRTTEVSEVFDVRGDYLKVKVTNDSGGAGTVDRVTVRLMP